MHAPRAGGGAGGERNTQLAAPHMERDARSEGALRPYPHQVGGHGQLAMTPAGRLLKPLSKKEHDFYCFIHSESLPLELRWLRTTTPKFYGEAPFPHMPPVPAVPSPGALPALQRPHSRSASTCALEAMDALDALDRDERVAVNKGSKGLPRVESDPVNSLLLPMRWRVPGSSAACTDVDMSPWAVAMTSRWERRAKLAASAARRPRASIALEDINRKFLLPCVMDCKIGTRHYDDDATEEKQRKHIAKANATTSAKCGVRFTGMQSYKRGVKGCGPGAFEFRDKYHGRRLKAGELVTEAAWFFHDGRSVRTDCVLLVLDKLHFIRDNVAVQKHFKFYSSSLLLVYEGAPLDIAPRAVDVRMIDFAHTQRSGGEPDKGYLFGVQNLIKIMSNVLQLQSTPVSRSPGTADSSPIAVGAGTTASDAYADSAVAERNSHARLHCSDMGLASATSPTASTLHLVEAESITSSRST